MLFNMLLKECEVFYSNMATVVFHTIKRDVHRASLSPSNVLAQSSRSLGSAYFDHSE